MCVGSWTASVRRHATFLALATLLPALLVAGEDADFRSVRWGMSRAEVVALEGTPVAQQEGTILYEDRVLDMDVHVGFVFVDDQLVRAKTLSAQSHSDNSAYYDDFTRLKAALTEKYGDPETVDALWSNDLFKKDFQQWGLAACAGHVMFAVRWKRERTSIGLYLDGDNFECTLQVEYISLAHSDLEDRHRKRRAEEKL